MITAKFRTPREQLFRSKPQKVKLEDVNIEKVISVVAEITDIPKTILLKKCRKRDMVLARNMCFFILHVNYKLRASQIAPLFKRDRTTVLHGINTFVNDVDVVPFYMEKYQEAITKLDSHKYLYVNN